MNYQKNFLTQVIFRLDFADRLNGLVSPERPEFTKAIAQTYPHIVENTQVSLSMSWEAGNAQKGVEQTVIGRQWRHRKSADAKAYVVLDPTYFAFECEAGGFSTFTDFYADLAILLTALRAAYPNQSFTRAGLRFVNQVSFAEGGALDWEGLINESLVDSVFAAVPEPGALVRSMHQVTSRQNDITSVFSYGILNPDFPNIVARRHFLMDIDSSKLGAIPYEELEGLAGALNARCELIFESSIEDELREKMGVIGHA